MGYTTNGAGRAAHEALLARQDAELRLMEAMKRSLQAKMKSDREYALALSAAAAQGQKMDKCEELNGKYCIYYTRVSLSCRPLSQKVGASRLDGVGVKIINSSAHEW